MPEYTSQHPIINVTVDARILVKSSNNYFYLLIRRGGEPFKGKLAMPGGFVNPDEHCHDAMMRELKEETGIDVYIGPWDFLCLADDPDRDPRGRTISIVYDLYLNADDVKDAVAGDDAAEILLVPTMDLKPEDCAFDHYELLKRC